MTFPAEVLPADEPPVRALGVYTRRAAQGFQIETYHDAYSLNESAGFIWSRIGRGETSSAIAERVAARYRISPEQSSAAVTSLLTALRALGFVTSGRQGSDVDSLDSAPVRRNPAGRGRSDPPDEATLSVCARIEEAEVVLWHRASPLSADSHIITCITAHPPVIEPGDDYLDGHAGSIGVTRVEHDGRIFEIHRIGLSQVERTIAIFGRGVPTQESGGLNRTDRALVRRLVHGVPVKGARIFSGLRDQVLTGSYGLWFAEARKYFAENCMEDVAGLLEVADHSSAAMCVRDAFVFALEGALALEGDLADVWEDFEERVRAASHLPLTWAEVAAVLFMDGFTVDPQQWVETSARATEQLLLAVEDSWFDTPAG